MSKTNFTPGPWSVNTGGFSSCADWKETFSVKGPPSDFMYLENIADARLIAAAPELYAVCDELREAFSYFSEWDIPIGFEERLDAALAKARGEN